VVIAHHVGDLQIFQIDGVVVPQQMQRFLVMEVAALSLHLLMVFSDLLLYLLTVLAPLFAASEFALLAS
jgi:hypothetical protein